MTGTRREPDRLGMPLSGRELEALRLCAEGRTYADVAVAMGVRENTVRGFLTRAFRKLGCDIGGRGSAVAAYQRLGWLDPNARPRAEFHHTPATWTAA